MSARFASDRAAELALAAALLSAAALMVTMAWSGSAEAPLLWARARWTLVPTAACVVAGAACVALAWVRRADPARWVPLAGGALVAALAVLGGAFGQP